MHAEQQPLFALAVAYAFVYYLQAIVLIRRIRRVDSEVGTKWGATRFGDARLSGALISVVFDTDLPKREYVRSLRWHVYGCRAMFVTVPLALVAAVVVPALGRG